MRFIFLPLCLLLVFQFTVVAENERFMVLIHRHGDRTPILLPDNYKADWPQGPGQLTGTGVNQLFLLGETIRGFYPELPTNYTYGTIYSRASDTDRTLQSAQSMMVGLFPPFTGPTFSAYYPATDGTVPNYSLPYGFQPVPIHSILADTDYELRSVNNCAAFNEYFNALGNTREFIDKQNENSELLQRLSTAFNTTITLTNLDLYYDLLACEYFHGIPDRNGFSVEDVQQTMELYDWVTVQAFSPSRISPLIGGALLNLILEDMENKISNKSSTIARFYSAHDTTIQALLSILGETTLIQRGIPPYAAYLMFLLTKDANNQYFVQMYYNSVNESVPITLCGDHEQEDIGCPFDYFKAQAAPHTLSAADAEMKCSFKYAESELDSLDEFLSAFGFFVLGAVILGIITLIIVFTLLYIRHRNRVLIVDEKEIELPEVESSKETEINF